jgi:hypothetical protein
MSPPGRRDFLAAAWWTASLDARPALDLLGRWRSPLVFAGAGVALGGCADVFSEVEPDPGVAALEQQEQSGWNVGSEGRPLVFPNGQANDVSGGDGWREALSTLTLRLTPAHARWAPYYNPTLFQSLESWRNADLRAAIQPIYTPEMALALRRGEVLLSLLLDNGVCRKDVAIVLDVPGPEAVAVAAALAPCFDPVFVFGNWPHPAGVVPAHLTLSASLYFLPSFDRARASRPLESPPMFVLDRQRLAHYTDAAGQFDNRYLAGLPAREVLAGAGVRHILYITPDDSVFLESDDLNDDLVAADAGGIGVKMLALSDFAEAPLPDWPSAPCDPAAVVLGATVGGRLYFGGSPAAQSCFSVWYGLQLPQTGNVSVAFTAPPPRLLPRCRFRPAARATFGFAAHAPGAGWPSHGGWAHGGWAHGGAFGRSGSLGRAHGASGFSG